MWKFSVAKRSSAKTGVLVFLLISALALYVIISVTKLEAQFRVTDDHGAPLGLEANPRQLKEVAAARLQRATTQEPHQVNVTKPGNSSLSTARGTRGQVPNLVRPENWTVFIGKGLRDCSVEKRPFEKNRHLKGIGTPHLEGIATNGTINLTGLPQCCQKRFITEFESWRWDGLKKPFLKNIAANPRFQQKLFIKDYWNAVMTDYEARYGCQPTVPMTFVMQVNGVCSPAIRNWTSSRWGKRGIPQPPASNRFFLKDTRTFGAAGIKIVPYSTLLGSCDGDKRWETIIASQYVEPVWKLGGKKFDMRVWVLIANFKPFTVYMLFHSLQLAVANFSGSTSSFVKEEHVTNPHVGMALNIDMDLYMKDPYPTLAKALRDDFGAEEGASRMKTLFDNARRTVMNYIFAMEPDMHLPGDFIHLGLDLAPIKESLRWFLLDSNTGPGIGCVLPEWCMRKNARAIPEMLALAASAKQLREKNLDSDAAHMPTPTLWEPIYTEGLTGTRVLSKRGECPTPSANTS